MHLPHVDLNQGQCLTFVHSPCVVEPNWQLHPSEPTSFGSGGITMHLVINTEVLQLEYTLFPSYFYSFFQSLFNMKEYWISRGKIVACHVWSSIMRLRSQSWAFAYPVYTVGLSQSWRCPAQCLYVSARMIMFGKFFWDSSHNLDIRSQIFMRRLCKRGWAGNNFTYCQVLSPILFPVAIY